MQFSRKKASGSGEYPVLVPTLSVPVLC